MKKVIYFLLVISLFLFIACEPNTGSSSSSEPDPVPEATPEPTPTPTPTPQPQPDPQPDPEPDPEPEPPVIVTHTIQYVLNGGSWIEDYTAPETYNEGQSLALPDASKINYYYTFDGWYDNSSYEGDSIETIPVTMKKDLVLYAKWIDNQTISLANNYTPTVTFTDNWGGSTYFVVNAEMPSTCYSSEQEIYKYGIYIDDLCVTICKSGETSYGYDFTNYARSLTPGKHVVMVTVEIFDVPGSYSGSCEFTVE